MQLQRVDVLRVVVDPIAEHPDVEVLSVGGELGDSPGPETMDIRQTEEALGQRRVLPNIGRRADEDEGPVLPRE